MANRNPSDPPIVVEQNRMIKANETKFRKSLINNPDAPSPKATIAKEMQMANHWPILSMVLSSLRICS